jgi:hypothetical protein
MALPMVFENAFCSARAVSAAAMASRRRSVGLQEPVDERRVLATGALGFTDDVGVLPQELEINHAQ